jgi:hypothetical protein
MGEYIRNGSTFAEAYRKAKEKPAASEQPESTAVVAAAAEPSADAELVKNKIVKLLEQAVKKRNKSTFTKAKALMDTLESLL